MVKWLCDNCEGQVTSKDSLEEQGLVIAGCLAFHHPLAPLFLYRAQGIPLTQRIPIGSPEDATISKDTAKYEERLDELDSLEKFGPVLEILMRIVDFPNIDPVRLKVQEFTPQKGDITSKSYDGANGEKKQVETAPFCIANIRQYRDDQSSNHMLQNYGKLASAMGGNIKGIYDLSQSDEVPQEWKEFYTAFSLFIFAALLKTSSGELVGTEFLGTEPIDEPGHRLHGKRICPRMLIAQTDPLETIEWLAPGQKKVFDVLLPLLESKDINDWAPAMAITSALNQLVAFSIKDRIRHGRENFQQPFSIPEYVNDAMLALMVLITKFHKMESAAPYTRDEAVEASPKIYQIIFHKTSVTNYKKSRNFGHSAWWNGQLFDTNPDWTPYPPILPGDKVPEYTAEPTFEGLIWEPITHDNDASW